MLAVMGLTCTLTSPAYASTSLTPQSAQIDSGPCYQAKSKSALKALATEKFAIADKDMDEVWRSLRYCLAESDPTIRDDVAFSGYSHWLRQGRASLSQQRWLLDSLQADLNQGVDDTAQVYRPFAILTLSELIRADRIGPYLTAAERTSVVKTVSAYLADLRDRRGFSADVGWRHGTAHAADAVLQLALNPATTAAQLVELRRQLALHISPAEHAYRYGESARIARAFVYLQQRPELTDWSKWWATQLQVPIPADALYHQEQGLIYVHNSRAFWLELIYQAGQLSTAAARDLQAMATTRLAEL